MKSCVASCYLYKHDMCLVELIETILIEQFSFKFHLRNTAEHHE